MDMIEINLDKNTRGNKNNKEIIGRFDIKNYFLKDTFGQVYYVYDGISEELINSNVYLFEKCLNFYNKCVTEIKKITYSSNNPSDLLEIYRLYQIYLHNITISDFSHVKSFFWQEKLYDIDALIEDNNINIPEFN